MDHAADHRDCAVTTITFNRNAMRWAPPSGIPCRDHDPNIRVAAAKSDVLQRWNFRPDHDVCGRWANHAERVSGGRECIGVFAPIYLPYGTIASAF